MFDFGVVPGTTDQERSRAYQQRLERLRLDKLIELLKYYEIKRPEKHPWYMLAYRLACDFVPGMKVAHRLPTRGRRPQRWGLELAHRLFDEVEAIKAERPQLRTSPAIELLRKRNPKDWGRYKRNTLETRYYEIRKKRQDIQLMSARGLLSDIFDPVPS
jgi:hypothetical protein